MAATQYYVDPSINAASGAGTVGSPYGDLQHALDTVTRDATNGDQFNVKAGTSEILAAALTLATYGVPTAGAPLVIRGYTAAANDGGIGVIDGNGSLAIYATATTDYVTVIDMRLTNCGSATIWTMDNGLVMRNVQIDTTTGSGVVADQGMILGCHFHNIGGIGCSIGEGLVQSNFFKNGTNDFSAAISQASEQVIGNIISVDGTSNGITFAGNGTIGAIVGNSIWSNAGTGKGITNSGGGRELLGLFNNIVAGFSGVGGIGIEIATGHVVHTYGHNGLYQNTTPKSIVGDIYDDLGNDIDPFASDPFTDAANDDFTVSTVAKALGYGNFLGASTNQFVDIGAAQREEPAGGGGGGASIIGG